jgi:hypothetical protein
MIKLTLFITAFILFCLFPGNAQVKKQDTGLKREVTLYNPYKPTLPESGKLNYLPDMNDTVKVRPVFKYEIIAEPFLPAYSISPLKAAALEPDPLPKLYKSFVNIGLGNYITPLAEISITNERSKKGAIGFYGRHFSTNGKVKLDNGTKVFAGYMDNDISLFGRKFFRDNVFEGSVDYSGKTRYAYGYDTSITNYEAENKDIRLTYNNIGAKVSLTSMMLDSARFSYDFDIIYNFFYNTNEFYQHSIGLRGMMAKSYMGLFYMGSGISFDYYSLPDTLSANPKYIVSISPFIKKRTGQWNFKLGFQALIDNNNGSFPDFHIYPDLNFGFNIVPAYISFFSELSGKLEKNDPLKIISVNPFLKPDGSLFKLPNTDHELIVSAGLKGNSGLGGNYLVSASYSLINNMVFFSNIVSPDGFIPSAEGNYFTSLSENAELLNIHAEMNGAITGKLTFKGDVNYNRYTLDNVYKTAWGKPDWDAKLGLKYNLKDKIIAGMEIYAEGSRKFIVNGDLSLPLPSEFPLIIDKPSHFNLNLSAEYRYSKILSLWAKFNNISYDRYYEWAYYPSQRFLCMVGFTYSL